ncbi:MAG TPA: VWA domain-containing protein [Vicinamibacteria bacterium]|jgi:Ca-activated chloride channel family protein|nr:VWA domain-containing protein [Vicinamibacteria bacterium]
MGGTGAFRAASAVVTLLGVSPLLAQAPPQFGIQTNLVVLSATALDSHGRPVQDLRPEEVRIWDEGRPQKLSRFSQAHDLQARVLLLVDASGSMNGELKVTSSRMAILQLLTALGPEDEVALAGFDSRYFGLVPFTKDRQKIEDKFSELAPFGSTALHDALDHAAADLASHGEGRRAVVVITDGVDNASQRTAEEVIARSRALDVPIYAVSVISPLDDPKSRLFAGRESVSLAAQGSATLERYASLSGGAAFAVSDFRGLKGAADQIANELKHQYRLGYDPPEGPAHFRRIQVQTTRRGVVIRTRSGYMPSS